MLKCVLLLVLAAVCLSQADTFKGRTADVDSLRLQSKIFELLMYVRQNDLSDADFYLNGLEYKIEDHKTDYDQEAVEEFLYWREKGFLNRGATFSTLYEDHRREVYLLFRLMYTAKIAPVFYKVSCWARIYMNDGVFTNAFYAAVFYRKDMQSINLMKHHEIYPNFFFESKFIEQAKRIKMTGLTDNKYTIYANETTKFFNNDEYRLSYFMEDYELNNFYFYFRQMFPIWMSSTKYPAIPKEIRGTFYLYIHQQLMARYYLERFSNGLGEIEDIDWQKPFFPGFHSSLELPNGVIMPTRMRYSTVPFHKYEYLKEIESLEYRLLNAIDSGYVLDHNGVYLNIRKPGGLNILGNIIEGNEDSLNKEYYNMYEYMVRNILGYNNDYIDKQMVAPSSLYFYSTSMRDPGFYRIFHRINNYVYRFKQYQKPYGYKDLVYPGVSIQSVNVDKLQTFFKYCDSNINNAVYVKNMAEGSSFNINMCHYCLDYVPFTYTFYVNSSSYTDAAFKIFLGPSGHDMNVDEFYLRKYYKYFVELDEFHQTLVEGQNTVKRSSEESVFTASGMEPSHMFYKKLQKAIGGSEPYVYQAKKFGYPRRLTLPKGSSTGMKFKMFFFMYPYNKSQIARVNLPYFEDFTYDDKPFGYPFDRPTYTNSFFTPNMYFQDVVIYNSDNTNDDGTC